MKIEGIRQLDQNFYDTIVVRNGIIKVNGKLLDTVTLGNSFSESLRGKSDEEIKDANILDEPRYVEDDWLVSGDFDLDRTTMFPLIPNLVQFTSGQLSLTNLLNIENLVYNIEKTDELNIDCIINDKKLILALEIYSKLFILFSLIG